jgi:ring-1,2-phenylacetyl-CoA epoxidase subunit PaaD
VVTTGLDQRGTQAARDERAVEARSRAWRIAAAVPDPELPVLTIGELGILRDVTEDDQSRVHVTITPTYSGCPAMETISTEVIDALTMAGFLHVDVEFELSPPWTTEDLSPSARAKLAAYGIAPPRQRSGPQMLELGVRCPQCGSVRTRELSRFGSTACQSLWVCRDCREPFPHLKTLQ